MLEDKVKEGDIAQNSFYSHSAIIQTLLFSMLRFKGVIPWEGAELGQEARRIENCFISVFRGNSLPSFQEPLFLPPEVWFQEGPQARQGPTLDQSTHPLASVRIRYEHRTQASQSQSISISPTYNLLGQSMSLPDSQVRGEPRALAAVLQLCE